MGRKAQIATAIASNALRCTALAVILASGTPGEATLHMTACPDCAASAVQGGTR